MWRAAAADRDLVAVKPALGEITILEPQAHASDRHMRGWAEAQIKPEACATSGIVDGTIRHPIDND